MDLLLQVRSVKIWSTRRRTRTWWWRQPCWVWPSAETPRCWPVVPRAAKSRYCEVGVWSLGKVDWCLWLAALCLVIIVFEAQKSLVLLLFMISFLVFLLCVSLRGVDYCLWLFSVYYSYCVLGSEKFVIVCDKAWKYWLLYKMSL